MIFRQLMASYPNRSWAKLYNQMWNLTMKDPVQKSGQRSGNFTPGGPGQKEERERYCWKFNKNRCKNRKCE